MFADNNSSKLLEKECFIIKDGESRENKSLIENPWESDLIYSEIVLWEPNTYGLILMHILPVLFGFFFYSDLI